ncbi:MAG: GNAT family N-acetyltransferase [Alphaproteobacteria bacterium]
MLSHITNYCTGRHGARKNFVRRLSFLNEAYRVLGAATLPCRIRQLIDVEGVTAGYVVITMSFSVETGGRDGFIDALLIKPELRNQGLGQRVRGLVDEEARTLGLGRMYLEVEHGNPAMRPYRRAGYSDHERCLLSKWL